MHATHEANLENLWDCRILYPTLRKILEFSFGKGGKKKSYHQFPIIIINFIPQHWDVLVQDDIKMRDV